jgi:hypothetical protein
MTQDQFKQLQVGDRITHPAFIGFLTIAHIETTYDCGTTPASQWTDTFTTDTGHRMKIGDTRDVLLLRKLD